MKDGSDAVADWPLLNALLNTAAGASWVSIHNGGGVGIGYSLHAGQVTVADGTEEMAKRIERVLTTWARGWTAEMPLKRTEQPLYEYACHEGNFPLMTGVLSGAHAADKGAR